MPFGCRRRGRGGLKAIGGALGALCLSAVWQVVAEAGPAPARPVGDVAGRGLGGERLPGADFADVGCHEQQRGEDRLCSDAADAASGGLGEGFVSGVFDETVEAFDGVPQGGVGLVPGGAAVGQVLTVAGAGAGGDGDGGLLADLRRFFRRLEYLGPPVAR